MSEELIGTVEAVLRAGRAALYALWRKITKEAS